MAYNNNIPLPRDRYRISQGDILQNFQAIDTVTQVNHVLFNDADQGIHKFVQFPRQSTVPTTGGTEVAVYGEQGINNPLNNPARSTGLVFERSSGATVNFTDTSSFNVNSLGFRRNILRSYWNRLPSGLLVKAFAIQVNVNPNNQIITTPITTIDTNFGPDFTTVHWINVTPARDVFVDPTAVDADPNVALYITSHTNTSVSFNAFTRNLFSIPRSTRKFNVFVSILIFGV